MRSCRLLALASLLSTTGCLIERAALRAPDAVDAFAAPDAFVLLDTPDDAFVQDAPLDDAPVCEGATRTLCEGVCIDTSSDDANCGACGVACDALSGCVAGACACDLSVYGGCEPGLRIWLDAQNTTGSGSPEGALTRWTNLARTDAGDAVLDSGTVTTVAGVEGNTAVRFGMGRLRTSGPMAGAANTHMEVFIVARSRDLNEQGFTLGTQNAPPNRFDVHLPWNGSAFFDFPLDASEPNGRVQIPFTRSPRHITLWHAYQGNSGGEVRVNGTLVNRSGALSSASRDFTQRLWVGGVEAGFLQDVDIHELLIFDQPLTEATRTRITRGLISRWHLVDDAPLPTENMFVHLDATRPLATAELPVEGALPVWIDRSDAHHDAPTVGVRWEPNGLGDGLPSVRLRADATQTNAVHVDVPRPSDPFTAFLVMATEDGRGTRMPMQCPSVLATEFENTDLDGGLLLCGGRPAFFRGGGTNPTGATLSAFRIDDGRRHLLIVRRASTGATTVTVDHEIVINGTFGGPITAANWLIGRHEGTDRNGTLEADLGELLVYDAALDDDTVNAIERTLRARWRTPVYSRPTFVRPCDEGTQAVCPYQSLRALREAPTGTYWLQLGGNTPFRVSVDDREGGGWVLAVQYVRQGGAPAATRVVQSGFDWPLLNDARIGLGPQRASAHWGHVGVEIARLLTDASELRWYGTTAAHSRVIHFASTVGVATWVAGRGDSFDGIESTFTALTGHTANLPTSANTFWGNGETILTDAPYFRWSTSHWIAGAGNRWEVDDYPGNGNNATLHRVWVRASAPL
jgi:hypothetical protein